MFVPKLVTSLKGYTLSALSKDVVAGIVVGIVALPLSIAFAVASGVSPERGLITAIIAGFLISALGGSRVQIGGPTGAFVVVIYGVVKQFGTDGLLVVTVLAGILLVLMGLVKLGAAIRFIPAPVITGFTSGIAVIIFSSQIKDFFGLTMADVPAEFFAKWSAYFSSFGAINLQALALGLGSIAILVWWPRVSKLVPAPFVALIAATAAAQLLDLPVETIGSRFGEIKATLPSPALPHITLDMVRLLIPSAVTVAILAAVESLLSAVVADGMIGGKHRSNMELVAQGVANIAAPLFGGIPATGAIARTATNIRSGGRTPVAGMVHAVTLLVIMLAFGSYASLIPFASLAAILIVVAYHMSEWRSFRAMLKAPKSDVLVLLATFTLTVVVDLTVAIEVGMVLAAFLFMRRMALVANVSSITGEFDEESNGEHNDREESAIPTGVHVFEINGPFFFGAVDKFSEMLLASHVYPKILVLRMRNVPFIDASGLKALQELMRKTRAEHAHLIISEIQPHTRQALSNAGLLQEAAETQLISSFEVALERSRELSRT